MKTAKQLAELRSGLCPLLTFKNAAKAIEFYEKAFAAQCLYQLFDPVDRRIGHAEVLIHGNLIMLADEYPEAGALCVQTIGGSPIRLNLIVPDSQAAVDQAAKAGATVLMPVTTHFYGDKAGNVRDPFGYIWMLSEKVEDVSPAEMQRRWNAMAQT